MVYRRKRSSSNHSQVEAEEADDLEVAAAFAGFPVQKPKESTTETSSEIQNYQNEPEGCDAVDHMSGGDKSSISSISVNGEKKSDTNLERKVSESEQHQLENKPDDDNGEKGPDSDEYESDSDLDDIEQDQDELSAQNSTYSDNDENEVDKIAASRGPTTENEIDPYQTPIDELQSNFHLNLTVEEEEHLRLAGVEAGESTCSGGTSIHLCTAGRIISHLVNDRTIVIESEPNGKGPLDEGSLIVVRLNAETADGKPRLLPLGKVFEVFGPVSRPLYIIRLPQSPSIPKRHKPANVEALDENEISLSDGDSSVSGRTQKQEQELSLESTSLPDVWAPNGKHTLLLSGMTRQNVFYIKDEARVLDTFEIMRTSGKGCDASNLYDEEVQNANELYFSDDEEERQFKRKGKKSNVGKGSSTRTQMRENQSDFRITGFHPTPKENQCRTLKTTNMPVPPRGFYGNTQQNIQPFHQAASSPYPNAPQYNAPVATLQPNLLNQQSQYQYPSSLQPYGQVYQHQAHQQYPYLTPHYQNPETQESNEESDTVYY